MNLYDIINKLQQIAIKQPNINHTFEGDVYKLATLPNIEYSVFGVTQTNHNLNEDTITYNLTLFHIDRVMNDESNMLQVQNNSILMLGNIINIFAENYDVQVNYPINFTTFTHKFNEICGGAFCNLSVVVDNNIGICGYE